MSNQPGSSKKKQNSSRDRDKSKMLGSIDSGGSSQCDTPPLIEKDPSASQGKYAGISPESIQCMAEQVAADMNVEAVINLAEDASYKLRQVIQSIALHSEMSKKTTVDSSDVNCVLRLMDSSAIVGCTSPRYTTFGEEKLCHQIENTVNISEIAMQTHTYIYTNLPTLAVEWVTDERSLAPNLNISPQLYNYYTNIAKAILSLKRSYHDMAIRDLRRNTRIGPIFPNLLNLAVLVLNDDNLNALHVPAKTPLQSNVLDMVDALCSNPCRYDTNITQQFQRLFPVMVSYILSNGKLSEKMAAILTKITRTWPAFVILGKGILFDYLCEGEDDRLTSGMLCCLCALGREPLLECLNDRLYYLDNAIHGATRSTSQLLLRNMLLDVSTCLLRPERTTWLEDYMITDNTLYEMLGDSIMPRRLLQPIVEKQKETSSETKRADEEIWPIPARLFAKSKFRQYSFKPNLNGYNVAHAFEPTKFHTDLIHCRFKINVRGVINLPVRVDRVLQSKVLNDSVVFRQTKGVTVATGLLNRFKYKLKKRTDFTLYGFYTL